MDSARIRRLFLDFFVARGHREVPSSPLVPADDPSLLFTNAGMVQFKRVFLGQEQRDYVRATTCQKCVRAGGKHNDLEQVGHTKRHQTFFEMLGNFSFGDYFKREAIAYAWEFVTSPEFLGIAPERIRISVHHADSEARGLWREVARLPEDRIYGLSDKDNFWQMADTGPCGPCSEIYVDMDPGARPPGGQAVIPREEFEALAEAGRFLEIWNLVFMQYDRAADGTLTPLPKPSVDTGAGLERITAVMQDTDDGFHTDLFLPLLDEVGRLVGKPYPGSLEGPGASYRVLADHARAVAFLLSDGVYPSNEGRGYVVRRILRRAVRHAWLLGRREPTLAPLTEVVVRSLGGGYPELLAQRDEIRNWTEAEEQRFLETIDGGLRRLEEIFASGVRLIAGEDVFKLYDTYGFPVDLTQLIAAERGVGVDVEGFERALEQQRERSRLARGIRGGGRSRESGVGGERRPARRGAPKWHVLRRGKQRFVGYESTDAETELLAFRQEGEQVEVVLRENPFYLESGGQVSDTGVLRGIGWAFPVEDVIKEDRGTALVGRFEGTFEPTAVTAEVDTPRRRDIERNHSATHLVHLALRRHLGPHVRQQGSLVAPDRLRFDFSHHGPIDPATLELIERDINAEIWANHGVTARQMPYADALALGAMAFFAEKYGDIVRVIQMGDSIELCGGTHVATTGALGLFRFTSQGGVAAGVRRIEAVTGPGAYRALEELDDRLRRASNLLRAQPEHLGRRIEQLLAERERLERRIEEMQRRGGEGGGGGGGGGEAVAGTEVNVDGVTVMVGETTAQERDEVGRLADRFREGKRSAALILFGTGGGAEGGSGGRTGSIHVALTDDLVQRGLKAGDLLNRIAAVSGGRGGGRPAFASGSAGDPARIPAARAAAPRLVKEWLESA